MELTPQRLQEIRKTDGIQLPEGFPAIKTAITIPANNKISFLLDQGYLTNAYPVLQFTKGKNAAIAIGYAEALYIEEPNEKDWRKFRQKGNRNEIEGKKFIGVKDSLVSDGSDMQEFSSLWWRTFRYLQVQVETRDEPLIINDLYGIFTGYPLKMTAQFDAGSDAWRHTWIARTMSNCNMLAIPVFNAWFHYIIAVMIGSCAMQLLQLIIHAWQKAQHLAVIPLLMRRKYRRFLYGG